MQVARKQIEEFTCRVEGNYLKNNLMPLVSTLIEKRKENNL
jgi:hypothetical protein